MATAVNVAGESDGQLGSIEVGDPPSPPLFPRRTSITPLDHVTIEWDLSLDTGCLPVLYHKINRDGSDLADIVAPEANSFTDDITSTTDYPLGTLITYMIKAVNYAGESEYSEPLPITVGQPPDSPTNVIVAVRYSETAVRIQWDADVLITDNLATTSYLVYLDDLSGNEIRPVEASTPQMTFSDLVLGQSYQVSVSAVNAIGEGERSTPALDVYTGVTPSKMIGSRAPRHSSSTSTSITIEWLPPAYNGGSSLLEYRVYHDIGQTGVFT
jgi:hypothetical protein